MVSGASRVSESVEESEQVLQLIAELNDTALDVDLSFRGPE